MSVPGFLAKRKRFLFFIILMGVCLALLAGNIEKRKPYNPLDKLILSLFSFPLKITTQSINTAKQVWNKYFYLVDLSEENLLLKKKIDQLLIENQLLKEKESENERLRTLLNFKKKFDYTIVPSEIIGRDPTSWFKTILINKGGKDGVQRDCGVITPEGAVGKVIHVSRSTSKIMLITDINSAVDSLVNRTRTSGIVEGFGKDVCRLNYVSKEEPLQTGDLIVTSGLNGIFPKGVLIGTVSAIEKDKSGFFQHIQVTPSVDFSKLTEVLVVLNKKPDTYDAS